MSLPKTLTLAGLLLATTLAHAEDFTFAQARALMHERADTLKMSRAVVEQKQAGVKQARSLSGPKVEFNAKQIEGRKDVNLNLDLSGFTGALNTQLQGLGGVLSLDRNNPIHQGVGAALQGIQMPTKLKFSDEWDISGPRAAIEMTWPLYTGGAISAKQEASRAAVSEAMAELDATRDQLDTLLVQKYFGLQLARSVEKLRIERLANEQRDLHRAKRFEKAGMIAKIERMSAQVNRDTAERELLGAQTDRRVAHAELTKLIKSPEIGALDTPLFVAREIGSMQYWIDCALTHNPILRRIDAQHHQARMGVQAAKSAYHPQVYAFGHYNMIKHYLTLPESDWMAGIGVKFTLWDNRDRSARVGGAQALVNKADAARNEAREEIKKLVEIAYLRSEDALKQYDLTASTIALARENLRLREKSFKEGLSTVDDVNDARNKLLAAEVSQRVAGYRFVVAFSYLHAASGQMNDYQQILSRPDIVVLK